jgi:hypothetical protein
MCGHKDIFSESFSVMLFQSISVTVLSNANLISSIFKGTISLLQYTKWAICGMDGQN